MGKIHKALEKSKKEQQQAPKNPYASLKARLKDRRHPPDTRDLDRGRSDHQEHTDPNLESIHDLLDDTAERPANTRGAQSLKETIPDPEVRRSNDRGHTTGESDSVGHERKTDWNLIENKKTERSLPSHGKYTGPDTETVSTPPKQMPQDVIAQKIVSLKGAPDKRSAIPYLQDDGLSSRTDEGEPVQSMVKTGEPLRLHYSLVTLAKPKSFEAEQFKILRANLLFPKSGKTPKTILVTSAVPGEGKTFTAMNIAVSLAQNLNSHVLLVDADIRKPEIHTRFGLAGNIKGLSDFLTQNTPIASLMVKTPLPNLTILPGGHATINPSELISSEKMKMLLTELSTRYRDRFVIIDAPPPKLAAETYALARFVEHIIPVVRSGRSNRELVDEMMNLLGRDKIHGVVLNCYDIRKTKRFGYHKYSEYYSK